MNFKVEIISEHLWAHMGINREVQALPTQNWFQYLCCITLISWVTLVLKKQCISDKHKQNNCWEAQKHKTQQQKKKINNMLPLFVELIHHSDYSMCCPQNQSFRSLSRTSYTLSTALPLQGFAANIRLTNEPSYLLHNTQNIPLPYVCVCVCVYVCMGNKGIYSGVFFIF